MGRLSVVCVMLMAAVVAGCGPARSKDAAWHLSPEQCLAIGRAAAPEVERTFGPALNQPAVQAYVRTIGERVARCTPLHQLPYQFMVLNGDTLHAFAAPGGPVYVTRGLLEHLENEGQLAAVLAHQLAHINARQVGGELLQRLGMNVLLEAVAAADRTSGEPATPRCGESLGRAAGTLIVLQYSVTLEREADRLGLDYLVAAGYNPDSMARFLDILETMAGPAVPEFLRVHPSPPDRVANLRSMIERKYPDGGGRVAREEYQREVLDRLKTR